MARFFIKRARCVAKDGLQKCFLSAVAWLATIALLLILPSALIARDAPAAPSKAGLLKGLSVEELSQLEVVSTSRYAEEWGGTASNIYRMGEVSPRITGATTLPQLLRLAPQLFVAQSSSAEWGISARGFVRTNAYSNKLLVMIDGRSVYSPFFSNVFWDAQDIFLPDLDQIEVISGPAGVTYGSNAVNGVINIMTQSAFDTQKGVLYGGVGTHDENHLGIRQGGKLGENTAWRVYAKRMEFGSTLAADGTDDGKDPWHFSQGGFRTDWEASPRDTVTVQGDLYRGRYESGPILSPREADGANLLARWNRRFLDGSSFWVRTYHDYTRRDAHSFYTQTTHTTDLEFQHHFLFAHRQEVVWGGNYRHIDDRIEDPVGFAIIPPNLQYELGSIFGQHELHLADGLFQVVSGLRVEHHDFSGTETLPSLRLAWRPNQKHTLWVSGSRATRIPDRLNRGFHAPAEPPYAVAGGPHFGSEILHGFELGWRALPARNLAVTATLFLHDYKDLRSVEPTTPVTIANGVDGRSRGLELFVDWGVYDWWRIRAGGFYTEQETWLQSDSNDSDRGLGAVSFPEVQVQLRSTFELRDNLTLWMALRHVDDVPAFQNNQTGKVPAYTELDASINWQVRPDLELSLTGRNLLNPSHPEIGLDTTRREIRRKVHAMLRWSF